MRKHLASAAAGISAAPGLVFGGGASPGGALTTPNDLVVNLGASTGQVSGGASGSLYGIYDQGVASNNLIQGMGLTTTDTKAQDGQQHPGSDALKIVKPSARGGRRVCN